MVINGLRGHILRGMEDGFSEEAIEISSKANSTHLRDILSDKPGRGFASGDSARRSAMEPGSDTVHRDMQNFANEALDVLEAHLRDGHFNRLAIFAAPQMLGIIRDEMPLSLRKVIIFESDANLINLPEADLKEAIVGALKKSSGK